MITKQHTALYYLALHAKGRVNDLKETLPWVLLPDAIRMYVGARQAGHHEVAAERIDDSRQFAWNKRSDISWMEYPTQQTLMECGDSDEPAKLIKHNVIHGIKPCVIGEDTDIEIFDIHNWNHLMYRYLRIHLLQDIVMDDILRNEMVDCKRRYEDVFESRQCIIAFLTTSSLDADNPCLITLDGKKLRTLIGQFEELGFLRLAGVVYKNTGILLNREWFEENVLKSLQQCYPQKLAENTYKYMVLSDSQNERINSLQFDLTDADKHSVMEIACYPDQLLNMLHSRAYHVTLQEL